MKKRLEKKPPEERAYYDKLLREIRPILVRHYGIERAEKMIRDTEPIYDRFLAETPSMRGLYGTTQ